MIITLTCKLCGCRYASLLVEEANSLTLERPPQTFDARHECQASREASRHDGYGTDVTVTCETNREG